MCRKKKIDRKRNVSDNELRESLIKVDIISVKYNVNVSKINVRKALKELNPSNIQVRRRKLITCSIYDTKGPTDVYHIDDKDNLRFLAPLTDLVERYYGCMFLQATTIL